MRGNVSIGGGPFLGYALETNNYACTSSLATQKHFQIKKSTCL